MKKILLLLLILVTSRFVVASQVTLNEAFPIILPKGSKLEIVSEKDGVLICSIGGQNFAILADKTDYSGQKNDLTLSEDDSVPAELATTATNSLFDVINTNLSPDDILYSLPFIHPVKDLRLIIPKHYNKTAGSQSVIANYSYLTKDGKVVGVDALSKKLEFKSFKKLLTELQRKFPTSTDNFQQITDFSGFRTLEWKSSNAEVALYCLGRFPGSMSYMYRTIVGMRFYANGYDAQEDNEECIERRRSMSLPTINFKVTIYEVPRELVMDLLNNPAQRTDYKELDEVKKMRKRIYVQIMSSPAASSGVDKYSILTKDSDNEIVLSCAGSKSDLSQQLIWCNDIAWRSQRSAKDSKLTGGKFSIQNVVLELNKDCAIPLINKDYVFPRMFPTPPMWYSDVNDDDSDYVPVAVIAASLK